MFTLQIYTKPYSFGNIFINKLDKNAKENHINEIWQQKKQNCHISRMCKIATCIFRLLPTIYIWLKMDSLFLQELLPVQQRHPCCPSKTSAAHM